MSKNTKRAAIPKQGGIQTPKRCCANLQTSSTSFLKTKMMKTLYKMQEGNWKDQYLQQYRESHHSWPPRAQNAGGRPTQKAGGELTCLNSKTCLFEAEGEQRLISYQDPERGYHSMYLCGLVRTPIPVPKAMKIPAAKAAIDKKWDKLKNLSTWSESKVRAKADVTHEAQHKQAFSTCRNVDGLMPLETLRVGRALAKVQRTSRALRRQFQRRHRMTRNIRSTRRIRISDHRSKISGHDFPSTWNGWRSK